MKKYVGFIGWRGMVGSVLMHRMIEENNFHDMHPVFFSTSHVGSEVQIVPNLNAHILQDAYDLDHLKSMDIIVTCQGADYTNFVYYKLRNIGWSGYWIDAASLLRMHKDSIIVLDPLNIDIIHLSIQQGIKTFVGSNCTVSLMLMALGGLFEKKLVRWVTFSTYQAASGAGSKHIIELIQQMGCLYNSVSADFNNASFSVLDMEKKLSEATKSVIFPVKNFRVPLAGNILPWIDSEMKNGQTKEEWKVQAETNKILCSSSVIPIDGTCVRVGTFRCHSQSFIIKLTKDLSYTNIVDIIKKHNMWVKIVPNDMNSTLDLLTPNSVTGTLNVLVGRIRKLNVGVKTISVFTVGDQLLWGAAEPLRRILMILINL